MDSGPPQYIEPARLADTRDEISGVLGLDGMERLQAVVIGNTASIKLELQFTRDDQNRICIEGKLNTCLIMECQRCLRAVNVDIEQRVNVCLAADENESTKLPGDVEPILMTSKVLSLISFIEDELLLALPLAPNHDTIDCHPKISQISQVSDDKDRQHPFSVLKDFKLKNSKD